MNKSLCMAIGSTESTSAFASFLISFKFKISVLSVHSGCHPSMHWRILLCLSLYNIYIIHLTRRRRRLARSLVDQNRTCFRTANCTFRVVVISGGTTAVQEITGNASAAVVWRAEESVCSREHALFYFISHTYNNI